MKKKITKTELKKFINNSKYGDRYNDTEQKGFHARNLKNGLYLYYRYESPTGGRKTISLGRFPDLTIEKARKLIFEYVGRIAAGEDISTTIQTRRQVKENTALNYLKEIYDAELNKKADGKNIRADLSNHFGPLLTKPMQTITKRHIKIWQTKKEASGLHPKTIKKVFAYFNAMLNHAVKIGGVLDSNPLSGYSLNLRKSTPEEERVLRQKRTYLDKTQTEQFFRALDLYQQLKRTQNQNSRAHGKSFLNDLSGIEYVDYVKPIMLFLYYTGLRPGDALTMQWDEINFSFKSLTKVINKTKHKKEHPTTIPLSDECIKLLLTWHKQHKSPKHGYVFANPKTNKPYYNLYKPWKKLIELGELPKELENYTLRHNFISHLIMNGANLLSVAKLATTSVDMIEKHYGHLQPDLQNRFINEFAQR
ncbi:tyrosine-type recombinase/integrase [Thiomicrorhabdus sp. Milos-T2]|uniref:tyrosine-type recombinase/integrase n=1 Tax=Thiomicrorhabdus sp. Milos-T2 TaxID=90814 RepID=UPI000493F5D3|nr:tyrosine-type recombinase/integrase [Thiomicrorhabdus sp. Milos-T2]